MTPACAPLLNRNERMFLAFLVGTSLLARGIAVGLFASPEMWEFGEIAANLLAGKGFSLTVYRPEAHPSAFMPPGYPFLIYGVYLGLGPTPAAMTALYSLNVLVGALGVIPAYLLAREITDARGGLAASTLWGLFPSSIFAATRLIPTVLIVNLGLWVCWTLLRWSRTDTRRAFLGAAFRAGHLAGLAALFRAEYPLLFAILAIWATRSAPVRSWRLKLAGLGLAVGMMALWLTPWTIRNGVLFDRFIPVANTAGFNLYRGHNPLASGTGRTIEMKDGTGLPEAEIEELLRLHPEPDETWEPAVNDRMRDLALDFIRNNPEREVELALLKLFYFWTTDFTHPMARAFIYWGPYLLIAPLFFIGLFPLFRVGRGPAMLVWVHLVFSTSLAVVFFVLPRYRMMMDPYLFIPVGAGFSWVSRRWRIPGVERASRWLSISS